MKVNNTLPVTDFPHRISPELLAMLSHELHTPINVLLGMADLMELTELTRKQLGYLRAIQGSGDSLLTLLDNFLEFSDLESTGVKLQKQEFDVMELLERVFHTIGYQAYAQGVELMVDAPVEPSFRVSGDPHRLRQVLVNLIGNRIRFGETGDMLVQVYIKIESGNSVVLQVSVTGRNNSTVGDLKEALSGSEKMLALKIDDIRLGSKLGLSACKRLLDMMGGQIGFACGVDEGTRAWVSVPLEKTEPQSGTKEAVQKELQGQSALVITGNSVLDQIICRYLETWGMCCVVATDISAALSRLRHDEAQVSVVIADAELIEAGGPLISSRILAKVAMADLPLVLLADIGAAWEVRSISSSGNIHFVTKPVLPRELRDNLLGVLGSGTVDRENNDVPGRLRILIAEDNTASGHMMIAMLRSLGCDPDYVEDGYTALKMLEREPYDLVLMDCEMPGLDGEEVTKELRANCEQYASQPVIVAVTATNSEKHRRHCLDSGMNGFIAKPIRLEELKKGLRQWPLLESVKQVCNVEEQAVGVDELESKVLERIYSRIGRDSTKIFNDYIDLFLSDSATRIQDLRSALQVHDSDMLSRQSHALKGACLEIGQLRMGQYCDDLFTASQQDKFDEASLIMGVLDKEFGCLRIALEAEQEKNT